MRIYKVCSRIKIMTMITVIIISIMIIRIISVYIYIYILCIYIYKSYIYTVCVGGDRVAPGPSKLPVGNGPERLENGLGFALEDPRDRERESFCCWQILTCSHKSMTVWWFQHVEKHVSTAILMFEHEKICVSPNNFDPTRGPRSTNFGASQP